MCKLLLLLILTAWSAIVLGDSVKRFESGDSGVSTVSSGAGDPGGVSYGTYQLASKTGQVKEFVDQSPFVEQFQGLEPGTPKFTGEWKYLAHECPDQLHLAEWRYIKHTHYTPLRAYATELGFPDTTAIDEALWSMGIQHGKAKEIVGQAADLLNNDPTKYPATEEGAINALYDARCAYVERIGDGYLVHSRYTTERQVVLRQIPGYRTYSPDCAVGTPGDGPPVAPQPSAIDILINFITSVFKK